MDLTDNTKTYRIPGVTWADTLRQAVRGNGESVKAIATRAGVPQPRLAVFMNGGDMTLRNAEKVGRAVGLELKLTRRRKAR
jgi:hypothetical protein